MNPEPALITGATSGIGYELAHLMARNGHPLILVARSADALEATAADLRAAHGVAVHAIAADLSEPGAPARLFDEVARLGIEVGCLVNNAGYSVYGPFVDADPTAELDMLTVNVVALTALTKLFVRPMAVRGRGRVLNVASTAAFQPGPLMACYYASKSYVLSFSEAIALELADAGVTVTALCPGPTSTNFARRANMESSRLFSMPNRMTAAEVAEVGYRAMMLGRPVAVAGTMNALMAFGVRFAPRWLVSRLVYAIQSPVEG